MTQKEELKILRNILWKIGYATIGAQKDGGKKLQTLIDHIRYKYCYPQSHSTPDQTEKELEQIRTNSLIKLNKI